MFSRIPEFIVARRNYFFLARRDPQCFLGFYPAKDECGACCENEIVNNLFVSDNVWRCRIVQFHIVIIQLKKWLKKISRKEFVPTAYSKVCSLHFRQDDFQLERSGTNPSRKRSLVDKRPKKKILNFDAVRQIESAKSISAKLSSRASAKWYRTWFIPIVWCTLYSLLISLCSRLIIAQSRNVGEMRMI